MPTVYLIETTVDGYQSVDLMNAFNAARLLEKGFENAYYSGIPFDVNHIFRYDDGTLAPLHIVPPCGHSAADENDYLHYPYEVYPATCQTTGPEFTFTVTIDGRA